MSNAFPGTGPSLENKMSNPDNVRMLMAEFLSNNKEAVLRLFKVHGISTPIINTDAAVRVAFLKAIKDSGAFREDASRLLAASVHSSGSSNFIQQPGGYFNVAEDQPWLGDMNPALTTTTSTTSSTTSTTQKSGSFWSSLGQIFTPDVIKKGINTGLDALNAKMQADANKVGEQNAIAYEAEKTRQLQAQLDLERQKQMKTPGMPAWAWITISVVVVGGIVTGVVLVRRRAARRKAAA